VKHLRAASAAAALCLLGAGGGQLDSAYVLQRYAQALQSLEQPKVVVYSYTVSQVGRSNIEQRHRVYRRNLEVRDETLAIDGITLLRKIVRFSQHADRYAVTRFAPSASAYEMLFSGTTRDGRHLDYVYETTPLSHSGAATIDRLTIDGTTFLPRAVHFRSGGGDIEGSAVVEFGPSGKYWMPMLASATARVGGKPAHEEIVWSDYRFPASLPPQTFAAPKPLPPSALPPI
jgi:hypothetical protein